MRLGLVLRPYLKMFLKKGIPLFNMLTQKRRIFKTVKDRMKECDFTCCIRINVIETCNEEFLSEFFRPDAINCRFRPRVSSKSHFQLLIEHQKNAHNVEYGAKFFGQDHDIEDQGYFQLMKVAQNSENYNEDKNSESDITVDESSESDTLETSSESDNENKKFCVECVQKNSKIQTLEVSKIKLETEITSTRKALEESKAESKVELEKVENQIQTEVALKKSLEESLTKYQKLKQLLATKVFQSNPSNEDLDILLNLEIEKLFEKYEQIMKVNDSNVVKVEEGNDNNTIKDKKLNLQILQRELYEKELDGIMDVLKMPAGDRVYTKILPMIKNLLEQVDTDHYTNAVENLINE